MTRKAIGARTFFVRRDAIDAGQFRFTLDVEGKDAFRERVLDFRARFTDTGESALCRRAASFQNPKQFAAGNNVEARAFIHEQTQDRAIRVCLNRIANQVIEITDCPFQPAIVIENRARAVDIKRSPEFRGEFFEIDALTGQPAVSIMKGVQAETSNVQRSTSNVERRLR